MIFSICRAQDAEVNLKYHPAKKSAYQISETLDISIEVIIPTKICSDGIENSNIFLSGLKILEESKWYNAKDNLWKKDLKLKIIANKKGYSKLTIFRKTDKGGFFIQEKFTIQ